MEKNNFTPQILEKMHFEFFISVYPLFPPHHEDFPFQGKII